MSTVLEGPMAKQREDLPTRIHRDALSEARIAASIKKMSLVDYISGIVMESSKRDIEDEMRRRSKPKKQTD